MKWQRPMIAGAGIVAVGFIYLWLVLLSPFTYSPPEGLPEIEARPHAVFVYGTLRFAPIRWLVIGRAGEPLPATLTGYRRSRLDLEPAPGHSVEGFVIEVGPDELRRLDRYERFGVRYDRVRVRLDDGRDAWVYLRIHD